MFTLINKHTTRVPKNVDVAIAWWVDESVYTDNMRWMGQSGQTVGYDSSLSNTGPLTPLSTDPFGPI